MLAPARNNQTRRCALQPVLDRLPAARFLDGESSKTIMLKSILSGQPTGLLASAAASTAVKMSCRNTGAATVSFVSRDPHRKTHVPDSACDGQIRTWPAYVAIKAFVVTDVAALSW